MTDVYITFRREDTRRPRRGDVMQFARLSFGGASLSEPEQRKLTNRFAALTACDQVRYYPAGQKALIIAVGFGEPDEKKFIEQVTACARQHYTVKRVVHAK